MSACTATDKPLISIVMAVYNPNLQWLREQLTSLNAQSYSCLELHILDDCSPNISFEEIQSCVQDCICAFPYSLSRNEKNLGSNKTFERLTALAAGEYIAYCDQDDIWLADKLERLQAQFSDQTVHLACCDMFVIDAAGRQLADSITKVRPRHTFQSGNGLSEGLLFSNFVTGCTMLIRRSVAQQAIPFCPHMVHDHYLALIASTKGQIRSVMAPLIRYRIHGANQTGMLAGVHDRESYIRIRIKEPLHKFIWLKSCFPKQDVLQKTIEQGAAWTKSRLDHLSGEKGQVQTMWKFRRFGPLAVLFELVCARLPEPVFMLPVRMMARKL